MRKKAIILVSLLVALGALTYYQNSQEPVNTPRSSLEQKVAQAKKDRPLSSAQESFLKIQLAIISYQVANRFPPDRLENLVPTYFDSVPINPDTQKPFEYTREGSKYKLTGLLPDKSVAGASGKSEKCKVGEVGCLTDVDFMNPNEIQDDNFRYDPTGKRDPFQPFDFSARPKNPSASSPLEQYDLGQLRLTAVLADANRGATGIVEDQAGKGFNVKIGTKIGINSGVVVAIEKDRLKILETETDLTGKSTQKILEMKIQAEPGGNNVKEPKANLRKGR